MSTAQNVSVVEVSSGPYFPAFALNTERYSASPRIQSKAEKYGPKNFEYGLFPSSVVTLSLSLYIFSCDKKKNSLKKGKLENIDVNRAKV